MRLTEALLLIIGAVCLSCLENARPERDGSVLFFAFSRRSLDKPYRGVLQYLKTVGQTNR